MRTLRWASAPLLAISAAVLVACGGGDPIPPKASIASITVAGDSLADVGTFGFKFTVQNAKDPKGYPIWTQLVANSFGLDGSAQCAFYAVDPNTLEDDIPSVGDGPDSSCRNFAVGSGRINSVEDERQHSPYLIAQQLEARAAQGDYAANELLMVDGGGNDAADVVGAYLKAQNDGGAALGTLLGSLLTQSEVAVIGTVMTTEQAIGLYMQRLATKLVSDITTHALNKGAQRVLILNAPDITLTPRFSAALSGMDSLDAANAKAGIQAWIGAFNATLAAAVAGDTRMAVVDFYADFTDQGANPSHYDLDNATEAVCSPTKPIGLCTDAELDANTSKTAGWWTRYAFSDSFHPTPYGHQLLAASVSRALARAGWL